MRRRRMLEELYWIALGGILILAATLALGGVDLRGGFDDSGRPTTEAQATVAEVKGSVSPSTAPIPQRSRPRPVARANEVVVAAVRGDCWVSLRRGSAVGEVLFEGLVVHGRRVRARGSRIFVRLGAAQNVDVTVGGEPRAIAPGTIDLVLDLGERA